MVIVETVALSIMVSNDIVVALILKRGEAFAARARVGELLLTVRRSRHRGDPRPRLPLLSFHRRSAARQHRLAVIRRYGATGSGLFGGMFWRRATARGAHNETDRRHPGVGLHAVPALGRGQCGHGQPDLINDGPWGITADCGRRRCSASICTPLRTGWTCSLLSQCAGLCNSSHCNACRRPSSASRQDIFVGTRSGADGADIPALALVRDRRGVDTPTVRTISVTSAPASRSKVLRNRARISLEPKAKPASNCCATRKHLLASGNRRRLVNGWCCRCCCAGAR